MIEPISLREWIETLKAFGALCFSASCFVAMLVWIERSMMLPAV